jgi:hypothetical protein
LNWHPRRLRKVFNSGRISNWTEASSAFAKACSEGPIVVIDGYPGRAASSVLETFIQKRNGSYRVVLGSESRALTPYETWSGVPACALGYDLENAQTIVSFGAPLLEDWGSPGRFSRLWAERAAGAVDPQLRLIQVESSLSRTAARAWNWVPLRAGGEAALAAGLARVLLEERLVPARDPIPPLTVAEAADQTGLPANAIRDLARTMIARTPTVAIARDNDAAVAALNVVLGAVGTRGGIVRKSKRASPYVGADTAIPSARAIVIDSSVPWDFIPQTDGEVFRFAAWDGGSSIADWLLPAPGFLEELTDVPTAPTSATETYAVAPGLVKAQHEVQSAAQFLGNIDSSLTTPEKVIHARCEELFRGAGGSLLGLEATPIAKLASVEKLEEQLWKGSVWASDAPPSTSLRCELKEWPTALASAQLESWSTTWPQPVLPPLSTKLYRESNLLEPPEKRTV